MQSNLKPNYQKSQYLLLALSNLQNSRQEQQNGASKQANYLLNSNVTHSRMTNAQRIMNNEHRLDDEVDEQVVKECPTCCIWKRWAVEQQLKLLQIQEALMSKQNILEAVMLQLKGKLQEQDRAIHLYCQQLAKCKGQITILNSQLQRYQSQAKELAQNPASAYHTPYKNNNSNRVGTSVKISQLTDDKKGSTAATKPQLEWSAFQTNHDRFKPKKDNEISKYQFENRMLKEYNSVLLQRLKQSKYRKHF